MAVKTQSNHLNKRNLTSLHCNHYSFIFDDPHSNSMKFNFHSLHSSSLLTTSSSDPLLPSLTNFPFSSSSSSSNASCQPTLDFKRSYHSFRIPTSNVEAKKINLKLNQRLQLHFMVRAKHQLKSCLHKPTLNTNPSSNKKTVGFHDFLQLKWYTPSDPQDEWIFTGSNDDDLDYNEDMEWTPTSTSTMATLDKNGTTKASGKEKKKDAPTFISMAMIEKVGKLMHFEKENPSSLVDSNSVSTLSSNETTTSNSFEPSPSTEVQVLPPSSSETLNVTTPSLSDTSIFNTEPMNFNPTPLPPTTATATATATATTTTISTPPTPTTTTTTTSPSSFPNELKIPTSSTCTSTSITSSFEAVVFSHAQEGGAMFQGSISPITQSTEFLLPNPSLSSSTSTTSLLGSQLDGCCFSFIPTFMQSKNPSMKTATTTTTTDTTITATTTATTTTTTKSWFSLNTSSKTYASFSFASKIALQKERFRKLSKTIKRVVSSGRHT